MSVDRSHLAQNQASRTRLRALTERLSEADLGRPLEGGWTVAAALAHLAFWDRWGRILLEKWEREGFVPITADADLLNGALLDEWLAIPLRDAARLSLAAAEAIDRKLEAVAPELLDAIAAANPRGIVRATHRNEHLDQIERALAG